MRLSWMTFAANRGRDLAALWCPLWESNPHGLAAPGF